MEWSSKTVGKYRAPQHLPKKILLHADFLIAILASTHPQVTCFYQDRPTWQVEMFQAPTHSNLSGIFLRWWNVLQKCEILQIAHIYFYPKHRHPHPQRHWAASWAKQLPHKKDESTATGLPGQGDLRQLDFHRKRLQLALKKHRESSDLRVAKALFFSCNLKKAPMSRQSISLQSR